ncbi:MAG: hypothetical protein J6T38_02245 [Bacteroidaceae bacterium]|nr:hypothetical protein [Bacteroidaceae bacterium]
METNNKIFLPQYTLDQLSEQVCLKLSYFNNSTWEGVPELCKEIEQEPRAVDTVIMKVKRNYSSGVAQGIYKYHQVLTRIYMLLYYRHRDDKIFQSIVFPELVKNMRDYANNVLKNIIQPGINRIIELDQMVEKAKEKEKKDVQPMFVFIEHSKGMIDRLYTEYCNESLFHFMLRFIYDISNEYVISLDEATVWYHAKEVVHVLRDVNHPEMMIRRVSLGFKGCDSRSWGECAELFLLCAYAMVCSSKDNAHFLPFIKEMEKLQFQNTCYEVIKRYVGDIKARMDADQPFDGYDYIGEQPSQDTFTRADMERYVSDYKAKLESLEKDKDEEIANLRNEIEKRDKELKEMNRRIGSLKQESKYSDEEVEEMKAELEDYRQHAKGLNPRQTAILGYKLADYLKVLPTDKQKLARPLSKISGWGKRSLEQKICGYFSEEEELEIANIFGEEFPEISKIISKKWRST